MDRMAKTTRVVLIDDIDGSEGDGVRNVTFAFNGREYEVDLSEDNVRSLEEALRPFCDAGRRVVRRRRKRAGVSGSAQGADA